MTAAADQQFFLDTNVLLSATDQSRESHVSARDLLAKARAFGLTLFVSGQILREYLVVATRPLAVNGLGMSPIDALTNVDAFRRRAAFCDESEAVSDRLRQLIRELDLQGKRIHDANVVAVMEVHGIAQLVTDNPGDFSSFSQINCLSITAAARLLAGSGAKRKAQ